MIPRIGLWIGNTEQAFHSLAERGHQWPSLDQLALQVRKEAHDRRRSRRSVAANSFVDLIGLGGRPTKPSSKSQLQTAMALEEMKMEGLVECRFLDDQGNPAERGAGATAHYQMVEQPEAPEPPEGPSGQTPVDTHAA